MSFELCIRNARIDGLAIIIYNDDGQHGDGDDHLRLDVVFSAPPTYCCCCCILYIQWSTFYVSGWAGMKGSYLDSSFWDRCLKYGWNITLQTDPPPSFNHDRWKTMLDDKRNSFFMIWSHTEITRRQAFYHGWRSKANSIGNYLIIKEPPTLYYIETDEEMTSQ